MTAHVLAGESATSKMPVLFVGHGSPMNAIDDNVFNHTWRKLGTTLPRPRAILCISAHWQTTGSQITAMASPPTIHDFGGFPQALFDVHYPAPGSPEWAAYICQLDTRYAINADYSWGLDHGSWSVLCHMFPEADIPVLQLSLDLAKTPAQHYQFARLLAPLRNEGILIMGSGNIVHNLREVIWRDEAHDWAVEINKIIIQHIKDHDHAALINYTGLHPSILQAVPTDEHYLPLLYILALQEPQDSVNFFNEKVTLGAISMHGVSIG